MTEPRTPRLIGLYSPAPQSGKSTVASYLTEHGFYNIPFAGPLKRMIRTFLVQVGYGPDTIDRLITEGKEEKIPGIDVTPRHLMQTLGTEWGRTCVHPDVWLQCWQATATRYIDSGTPVVCDDVRFPNEANLIRSLGGELWRIERSEATHKSGHASEGSLDQFPYFDRRIDNNASLLDLYQRINRVIQPTPVHA
jgi:hypothetical protein